MCQRSFPAAGLEVRGTARQEAVLEAAESKTGGSKDPFKGLSPSSRRAASVEVLTTPDVTIQRPDDHG
jgi:hypothetical protein